MNDINKQLEQLRREYQHAVLDLSVSEDPILQCKLWIEQAIEAQVPDPTAMVLASANLKAEPSIRVVLLKGIEDGKLIFFTHYDSAKGIEIAQNPVVAVDFFWPLLERQIIIKGRITRTSGESSDAYFDQRPRESQMAAKASHQSQPIDSREFLIKQYEAIETQFKGKPISRPENWGGFAITPHYIEFWQGRKNRLHDRMAYSHHAENGWKIDRLSP